jgi:hypothetical protein
MALDYKNLFYKNIEKKGFLFLDKNLHAGRF